jgi:hypothetical protein
MQLQEKHFAGLQLVRPRSLKGHYANLAISLLAAASSQHGHKRSVIPKKLAGINSLQLPDIYSDNQVRLEEVMKHVDVKQKVNDEMYG